MAKNLRPCNSTTTCSNHLKSKGLAGHCVVPEGASEEAQELSSYMDDFVEPKHPLHAERWQNDFINWVVHDDITFEQAASPHLRRVTTNGCPAIKHPLPTARIVSSWLLKTMRDRRPEVKAGLLKATALFTSRSMLGQRPTISRCLASLLTG